MNRTAIVVTLAAVGCGHSLEYTPLNAPPRALSPRDPASVEVFMASSPTRPHVEVGLIEIEQRTPTSGGTPEMVRKMRSRAGEIGCDATVISAPSDRVQSYSGNSFGTVHTAGGTGFGTVHGTTYGSANYVRSLRAACIVYTDVASTEAGTNLFTR